MAGPIECSVGDGVIYMSPQASKLTDKSPRFWGHIFTPSSGAACNPNGRMWCADNEVFSGRFSPKVFFDWLNTMHPSLSSCKFVVCPDSVSNAIETLDRFRHYSWHIKALGFPVAFVAQDGQESFPFPPEYDALFIGGSTDWKLSKHAVRCIRHAQNAGKWVHVGRVNSQKRIRHFQLLGVDSCDGTTICFAPDKNYREIGKQLYQTPLFLQDM